MRALIDTHVFVWWAKADHRLPRRVLDVLEDPESDLIFSMASLWEVALKVDRIGIVEDFEALVDRATRVLRLSILAVEMPQATIEGIPILTADEAIARYPVRVIW